MTGPSGYNRTVPFCELSSYLAGVADVAGRGSGVELADEAVVEEDCAVSRASQSCPRALRLIWRRQGRRRPFACRR
eukprot:10819661-Lingulodinium_polyedra.AAC.1